ncbi:unnamed protein product [Linum tenue]|uniref:Zinc-finger domain-containing protein n=1 Tax=Linum tenue TaxID=586396 RepID=A0AAV0MLR6_9ROSI|nr:unnamed protein product [Linum tenue]
MALPDWQPAPYPAPATSDIVKISGLFKFHSFTYFDRSKVGAEKEMVSTRRRRARSVAIAAEEGSDGGSPSSESIPVSGYEELRDQRIKENKERMEKLGLLNLSLKLKASNRNPRNVSSDAKSARPPPSDSQSQRRSSRLKTLAPVSYAETVVDRKKRESSKVVEIQLKEGSQPEIYTEEHERLLGNWQKEWTLSVDGYGEDGKRILDPVNGQTCHQCRQKALGLHTTCCKCKLVQGQFCGDCLFMRYGENVIEVNQNSEWICPPCRGICNCSLCRKEKGWLPTGNLYRKVTHLGFKSVAHFLIQTRRGPSHPEDSPAEEMQHSIPLQLENASEHQLGVSDAQLADRSGSKERVGDDDEVNEVKVKM